MNDLLLLSIFIAGILLLVRASGWLVSLLTWMAGFLKVSEYTAAFLLMAAATSIPELFVGITSALSGVPALSLGNVLGANLLNITLVIGIISLIRPLHSGDEKMTHETSFIFTLTLTPSILFLDGMLSRFDGAIMIFLFFAYIRYLFVMSRLRDSALNNIEPTIYNFKMFFKKLLLFLVGVLLLLIAARMIVFSAEAVAANLNIPQFLIGLIVISLGTTLPELTFGVRSALSGRGGMSLGNAIGSVVFNLLFILGLVAMIQPITIGNKGTATFTSLLVVTAVLLLLHSTLRVFGKVPRWAGIILILAYVATTSIAAQLSLD